MNAPEFKKLPGVLAFQRGLVITDALFFNVLKDGQTPVMVMRHGIRGTQNVNNKDGDGEKSTAANAKRQEVSNIQTTDTAKLDEEAEALAVRFGLRFLDLKDVLFACAPSSTDANDLVRNYRDSVSGFIERAKSSTGLEEVAGRFARNIANGRWLWRNRTIARAVEVRVSADGKLIATFNALATPLNHFDDISEHERKLAAFIAEGLRGEEVSGLEIEARLDFGVRGALEVFPSQNYVENKPRGFARPLYCLGAPERVRDRNGMEFESTRTMGHAALRDQKIGNALRTIDTWYPAYAEHGRPLPVEPNGASLEAQEFFRDRKTSAFEFARRLNTLDPASPEGMFMIASLIRGGVFSGGKE